MLSFDTETAQIFKTNVRDADVQYTNKLNRFEKKWHELTRFSFFLKFKKNPFESPPSESWSVSAIGRKVNVVLELTLEALQL